LQAWKAKVRREADASWVPGDPPTQDEVRVRITYFYENEAPDVDNIIKPIQDALVGLVYVDDAQVADTSSRKSKIDGAFKIKGVLPEVAVKLAVGQEFLRIQVLPAPNHEDLA
jgi:crossover junction endodeoxyribonuclease RusA